MCLVTCYLPTYLPTSLPIYLSTYLLIYLPTYLPTYLLVEFQNIFEISVNYDFDLKTQLEASTLFCVWGRLSTGDDFFSKPHFRQMM